MEKIYYIVSNSRPFSIHETNRYNNEVFDNIWAARYKQCIFKIDYLTKKLNSEDATGRKKIRKKISNIKKNMKNIKLKYPEEFI